ncbi:aspartyl-phosphate phosphatase Spo0E family protein [Sutcliffiella rhizosphaerae]|uniref:aspartyl-phosphate phosphatase Spo0E family protein n=1 Tax=Sutcliffiella rhizosphaerae TaxID=2880967 RepID=UPI001E595F65|nr:aspartyl-phosphate phosphatase Spo0E family protein [Sutcliffiella rhizosphaerae]
MGIHLPTNLQEAIERKREEMIRLSTAYHLQSKEVIEASTKLDSLINQYQKSKRKSAPSP